MNIQEEGTSIGDFLDFLYGESEGTCYIALKEPKEQSGVVPVKWEQKFFTWPIQKSLAISLILNERSSSEVYIAPALFNSNSSKKENVKSTQVLWCEFDGEIPTDLLGIPEPSLRIKTSGKGHEHWYWKLTDVLVNPEVIEKYTRALTYLFGADVSGWDANQVLRPPLTFNHKRQMETSVAVHNTNEYLIDFFEGLPNPPPLQEIPIPENIPAIEDVVSKGMRPRVFALFKRGVDPSSNKRSDALMSLGYYLAEANFTSEEILSALLNADERWGKFSKRSDRYVRLMEIVTRAKVKYPPQNKLTEFTGFESIGLITLFKTDIQLEWLWQGFLQKAGYMLLTGPPGVGKTQFALNAATQFALGMPFLDYEVIRPMRIGFFSLEMSLPEIKYFAQNQLEHCAGDNLNQLEENLRFFPIGEPIYLNREEIQAQVIATIKKEKLDGVVFDSMGSTTEGELSQEGPVKTLMDWNDHLRKETGAFSLFVHHHRKASGDNKKPNKMNDVYGNQYIIARATTILCLWETGMQNSIEVIPLKVRLSKKPDPFRIYRDNNLNFTKQKETGLTIVEKPKNPDMEVVNETTEEPNKPVAELGNLEKTM